MKTAFNDAIHGSELHLVQQDNSRNFTLVIKNNDPAVHGVQQVTAVFLTPETLLEMAEWIQHYVKE